jgi:hypothetical protein
MRLVPLAVLLIAVSPVRAAPPVVGDLSGRWEGVIGCRAFEAVSSATSRVRQESTLILREGAPTASGRHLTVVVTAVGAPAGVAYDGLRFAEPPGRRAHLTLVTCDTDGAATSGVAHLVELTATQRSDTLKLRGTSLIAAAFSVARCRWAFTRVSETAPLLETCP